MHPSRCEVGTPHPYTSRGGQKLHSPRSVHLWVDGNDVFEDGAHSTLLRQLASRRQLSILLHDALQRVC